jgi:hypothetical protein
MKKALIALSAAATVFVAAVATPTDADARRFRHGGAVAAGVIGGLALGGLFAAGAYGHPWHGGYAYDYGYAPVYGHSPYYSYGGPACYWRRQRVCDWGGCWVQRVQVC